MWSPFVSFEGGVAYANTPGAIARTIASMGDSGIDPGIGAARTTGPAVWAVGFPAGGFRRLGAALGGGSGADAGVVAPPGSAKGLYRAPIRK